MTNADGRQEEQQRGAEDRLEKAVRAAERALIEFEIAVETFRVEVENFSRLHHQRLGPMYTRLDELDALIAEAIAARSGDREDIRQAWEARALVMPMPGVEELFEGLLGSDGVRHTEDPTAPRRVRPSEEARRLYRELARKVHPDLAQDEDEQKRRGEFLARVNEAYADGDESALRALAVEWEAGPPPEEAPPSRAEELYARLEWLALRKETLAAVATELENSAIGQMLRLAPEDPDSLINDIAEQLLAQVAERERRLSGLLHPPRGREGSAPGSMGGGGPEPARQPSGPGSDASGAPGAEPAADPGAEPRAEPEAEPQTESQAESREEPRAEPAKGPQDGAGG